MKCKGFVHKYGNHIDTDVIIPAPHLNNPDPANLAAHCMEDIDKDFVKRVRPGILWWEASILAAVPAGSMPHCHQGIGHSCVIAKNFARIFFRNAINIGLPVLECPEAAEDAQRGTKSRWIWTPAPLQPHRGGTYTAAPFPPFMQEIISAGGWSTTPKPKERGPAMTYDIAVLAGDGIGPEITQAAVEVLKETAKGFGFAVRPIPALIGGAAIDQTGDPLPEETIGICKSSAAFCWGRWVAPSGINCPAMCGRKRPLRIREPCALPTFARQWSTRRCAPSPLKDEILGEGWI